MSFKQSRQAATAQRPPTRAIRSSGQERFDIPDETWAYQVLTPWQQAAAITLVVRLPEGTATGDRRTVIRDLTDAPQRLDAGRLEKASALTTTP